MTNDYPIERQPRGAKSYVQEFVNKNHFLLLYIYQQQLDISDKSGSVAKDSEHEMHPAVRYYCERRMLSKMNDNRVIIRDLFGDWDPFANDKNPMNDLLS